MARYSAARLFQYLVGLYASQTVLGSSIGNNAFRQPLTGENGTRGAIASESEICSQIGIDLLKKGGNAADAVVGVVACIGVVAPHHSGLGGGGFALVRAPGGIYESVDFREVAPAAAFEEMFKDNKTASQFGGLASGVPGEVRGLQYIHENYGALPWSMVLAPAVDVARYGWILDEDLTTRIKAAIRFAGQTEEANFLIDDPEFAMDFAPAGRLLEAGERITRKRYADTLETIAQQGPNAFYEGPMAEATIRALKAGGGTMQLEDLKNYTVAIRKPVTTIYRDYKLTACGAPSGGGVVLAAMNILQGYSDLGVPEKINSSVHHIDESMKFAYGMRAELGDPSFVEGLDKYEEEMLSQKTAEDIHGKIVDDKTFDVSYYDPKGLESLATAGTSHIVAADKDGMSISLTTTVNLLFGSHLVVPETGVIMNDQMDDFSTPNITNFFGYVPSPRNFIRPGKRPLSSVSPVIVEHWDPLLDDPLYLTIGAAGGSRIITATIQNLVHILDGNMTTMEALAQPRIHDQLVPAQIFFEYAFDNSTVAYMQSLGANVTWTEPTWSWAQALRRLPNMTFEATGEPRQKSSKGLVL